MTKVAWGAKVPSDFLIKVLDIVEGFEWRLEQASHLMACMAFESAETFSPSIKNAAGSGAVGLIQFMPNTAIGLSTTTKLLSTMTALEQLRYVERYFAPYHKRIRTLSDMYMTILYPKYAGEPEDTIIFSGGVKYRQNSGLDANKDGRVTKAETTSLVQRKLVKGLLPANCVEV